MKKLITISSKGLFTNRHFLQARPLTLEDFTIVEKDASMPTEAEDFKWIKRLYYRVTGTLKDELVQELNDLRYFRDDINKLIEAGRTDSVERVISDSSEITEPIRLGTENGGKVKSLANKLERTAIAKAELDSRVADGLAMALFVDMVVTNWNQRIADFISEHNSRIEKEIRVNLTNRSSLIDIIELNKNHFDEAETKVIKTFEKNVELIDESVEALKLKIEELEKAKSKEYIKLSQCVYKDELKEIPQHIREEVGILYSDNSTFEAPASFGRFPMRKV
jgi:hypothetical protein